MIEIECPKHGVHLSVQDALECLRCSATQLIVTGCLVGVGVGSGPETVVAAQTVLATGAPRNKFSLVTSCTSMRRRNVHGTVKHQYRVHRYR